LGPDLVPLNDRNSFYYLKDKLKPLDLIQISPGGLIVREKESLNGKQIKYNISMIPSDILEYYNFFIIILEMSIHNYLNGEH